MSHRGMLRASCASLDVVLGQCRRVGLDDDHLGRQPDVHQKWDPAAARGVAVHLLLVQMVTSVLSTGVSAAKLEDEYDICSFVLPPCLLGAD